MDTPTAAALQRNKDLRAGNSAMKTLQYKTARQYFERALAADRELVAQERSVEHLFSLSVTCRCLGDLAVRQKDTQEARRWYEECLQLRREIFAEQDTVEYFKALISICEALGRNEKAAGELEAAVQYFDQVQTLVEDQTKKTVASANASLVMARLFEDTGSDAQAYQYYRRAAQRRCAVLDICPAVEQYRDVIRDYRAAAEAAERAGDIANAIECYHGCERHGEALCEKCSSWDDESALGLTFSNLGLAYAESGNDEQATAYMNRMLYTFVSLDHHSQADPDVSEAQKERARRELCAAYRVMICFYENRGDSDTAARYTQQLSALTEEA